MNKDLSNIIQMIIDGKSNSEIISFRIKCLTSDDYKSGKKNNIFEKEKLFGTNISLGDSNNIIFKDGFIDENMVISHRSSYIDWCAGYSVDYSVFNYLLDYLRNNLEIIKEKNGISINSIMNLVRKYFDKSNESKYYDVILALEDFFKDNRDRIGFDNVQLFIRYSLPELICSYNASNYDDSIINYTKKIYLKSLLNDSDIIYNVDFDDNKLFSVLKLSELKGTNAVACTEYSILLQNFLCFLGYNSYLIGGKVNGGGHNYNVVEKDGKYRIIDVGQMVSDILPSINDPYDLLTFGEFDTLNKRKKMMHYESEFKK